MGRFWNKLTELEQAVDDARRELARKEGALALEAVQDGSITWKVVGVDNYRGERLRLVADTMLLDVHPLARLMKDRVGSVYTGYCELRYEPNTIVMLASVTNLEQLQLRVEMSDRLTQMMRESDTMAYLQKLSDKRKEG